jgi:L-aspartate oxidase
MAWHAGAEIANMEFIQFHPTSLFHQDAKSFLISEAVRGEGGILRRRDGTAFMADYDPNRKDLAPRDIVARAIDSELRKTGEDCVFLDITHRPADEIKNHFPTIYSRCLTYGIDITAEWIPVVPAAHYVCGGVRTDLYGRTSVEGLYACGEAACTGVHGANRLASNSLLEALVFGKRAADDALAAAASQPCVGTPMGIQTPRWAVATGAGDDALLLSMRNRLQRVMQKYVGIVRTDSRLQKAADAVQALTDEAHTYSAETAASADSLELSNMLEVSSLIIRCAQNRRESRGLNYNLDHPSALDSERHDTVVRNGE